jgi:hypothetical protein
MTFPPGVVLDRLHSSKGGYPSPPDIHAARSRTLFFIEIDQDFAYMDFSYDSR